MRHRQYEVVVDVPCALRLEREGIRICGGRAGTSGVSIYTAGLSQNIVSVLLRAAALLVPSLLSELLLVAGTTRATAI